MLCCSWTHGHVATEAVRDTTMVPAPLGVSRSNECLRAWLVRNVTPIPMSLKRTYGIDVTGQNNVRTLPRAVGQSSWTAVTAGTDAQNLQHAPLPASFSAVWNDLIQGIIANNDIRSSPQQRLTVENSGHVYVLLQGVSHTATCSVCGRSLNAEDDVTRACLKSTEITRQLIVSVGCGHSIAWYIDDPGACDNTMRLPGH